MADGSINFGLLTRFTNEVRRYGAGDPIFAKGEPGYELFVVKAGEVELRDGERVLQTVGVGGLFGEMALIDASPRSAAAFARTELEIVPLTEKQFVYLIAEMPYFALNVMRVLVGRLRTATRQLPPGETPV